MLPSLHTYILPGTSAVQDNSKRFKIQKEKPNNLQCFVLLFSNFCAESLKAAATAATGGGTFWTSGEHFEPKITLFFQFCSFVANHACLTVF